jgi:hypothetical protein
VFTSYDFGGIKSLVEYIDQGGEELGSYKTLRDQLLEVAQVWAYDILNPIKSTYDWQAFSDLFTELGYDDLTGAFGKWGLPGLDSEFWTNQGTIEKRIEQYFQIKAQGGPVQHQQEAAPQQQWGTPPGGQQQPVGPPPWQPQVQQGGQQGGWGQQVPKQQGGAMQCRNCGSTQLVQKQSRKQGPNFGRPYWACGNCPPAQSFVTWVA